MNEHFVHWLSPLDQTELTRILGIADYARQIGDGLGVLIGYGCDADYPNHENMRWLSQKFDRFFYIERIIVDQAAIGRGYGRKLYADIADFARSGGYPRLACEVNIIPDNPGSHKFHESLGFCPCGERVFEPNTKAVRYYAKSL